MSTSKNPPASKQNAAFRIDTDRIFHVTKGEDEGGIRHTWHRYRLVRAEGEIDPMNPTEAPPVGVEIIYSKEDKVMLEDSDAYNFLKMVKDRNAVHFDKTQEKGIQA